MEQLVYGTLCIVAVIVTFLALLFVIAVLGFVRGTHQGHSSTKEAPTAKIHQIGVDARREMDRISDEYTRKVCEKITKGDD